LPPLPPAAPQDPQEPGTTVTRLSAPDDAELTALLQQIEAVDEILEPRPHDERQGPVPTVTLAQMYDRQGFPERALEIYEQVLSVEPDNEAARRGAAELTAT
jgi:hypothetical protein